MLCSYSCENKHQKFLKKCMRVLAPHKDEEIIVLLEYEQLPDFGYNFGCIGHSFRDCEIPIPEYCKLKYGIWMKASNLAEMEKVDTLQREKSEKWQNWRGRGLPMP